MKEYDLFFIQNAPAFYKINLFNALSENLRVGVIFLGESGQVVMDKEKQYWKFDSYCMNRNLDKMSAVEVLLTVKKIWEVIRSVKYEYIVYGGWSNIEFVIFMFLTSRSRNCVISESSIYESSITGVKGLLKRWIINRHSHAFVSGYPHKILFEKMNFKGKIHITGGVGLAFRPTKVEYTRRLIHQPLRYIYTGRLIEKKNVKLLIEVFNKTGRPLTIIGTGAQAQVYKEMASSNIEFVGFVENKKLGEFYVSHDCFILPSNIEQWGLVVEEALSYGLPVIVSDMVGCNIDLVENYHSGIIFNHTSKDDLERALLQMENNYMQYKTNVGLIDFSERDKKQIQVYQNIL